MINKYTEYQSKSNIYFHHSLSVSPKGTSIKYSPEMHPQCELLLLLSGVVRYVIEGETYILSPGDFIMLDSYNLHSLSIDAEGGYERIVLHFTSELIPHFEQLDIMKAFNNARNFRHIIPKEIVNKTEIKNLLFECEAVCKKNDRFTDVLLTSIILKLLIEINHAAEKMQPLLSLNKMNVVDKKEFSIACTKYIRKNINKMLSAKDIADSIHVSESYLHHRFKKETGVTIHNYILVQKMQLAIIYLDKNYLPQQVSEMLGYGYYSSFYYSFKKFFGYSPNNHNRNKRTLVLNSIEHYH